MKTLTLTLSDYDLPTDETVIEIAIENAETIAVMTFRDDSFTLKPLESFLDTIQMSTLTLLRYATEALEIAFNEREAETYADALPDPVAFAIP